LARHRPGHDRGRRLESGTPPHTADAAEQVHVEADGVALELREQDEFREAGTKIVNGGAQAHLAAGGDDAAEMRRDPATRRSRASPEDRRRQQKGDAKRLDHLAGCRGEAQTEKIRKRRELAAYDNSWEWGLPAALV
jgi:hypothetical protein